MSTYKYKKNIDASGNVTFEKTLLSAINAENIVVSNPFVADSPVRLGSVLGAFKQNITELYGNVKYLELTKGTGSGSGSGSGGGSTTGAAYLDVRVQKSGTSAYTTVAGPTTNYTGSISTEESSYTFYVFLNNANSDTIYYLYVKNETDGNVLSNGVVITKSTSFTITGLAEGVSKEFTIRLKDSDDNDYTMYNDIDLSLAFSTLAIKSYLVSGGTEITLDESGSSNFIQTNVTSGYTVRMYFTPTMSGVLHYTVSTTIPKAEGSGALTYTGTGISIIANASHKVDFNLYSDGNFNYGKQYTVSVSAEILSTATGESIVSTTKTYSAEIIPSGTLVWTESDSEWIDNDSSFSSSYFNNGKNTNIDGLLFGNPDNYPSVYCITLFSYQDGDTWTRMTSLDHGTISDFPVDNYATSIADGSTAAQWMARTDIAALLSTWKTENASYKYAPVVYGTNVVTTIPYSSISSAPFTNEGPDGETDYANIKADIYLAAIDTTNNSYVKLPLDASGNIVPYTTIKAQVKESSDTYIPNYASGLQNSSTSASDCEKRLYFNMDPVTGEQSALFDNLSSMNNITDASFCRAMTVDNVSGQVSIPLHVYNTNSYTSGYVNNSLSTVNDYAQTALRLSGNGYGYINRNDFAKFLNPGSDSPSVDWYSMSEGFTIEILFRTDDVLNTTGTVFSMGDYIDGALSCGIAVERTSAEFTISSGSNTSTATVNLIQGNITQLDFVFKIDPASKVTYYSPSDNATKTTTKPQMAILMIYKNGVKEALASIELSNLGSNSSQYDMTFGSLPNGVTLGCKSLATRSEFSDVNIYGLRFYRQTLGDVEINRNWMISDSHFNRTSTGIDYTYMHSLLNKNYYDYSWICSLWDYSSHAAASATKMLSAFSQWSDSAGRTLPVITLTASTTADNEPIKSSNIFYASYTETQASVNNSYITDDNTLATNTYVAQFKYYDTSCESAITPGQIPYLESTTPVYFYMQGTSTQGNYSKNIELRFPVLTGGSEVMNSQSNNDVLFTPKKGWLPENRFTLKADVMDSAHTNNAAIGGWINHSGFMPKNPAQQDASNPYASQVKVTLEGFPCLVFVDWGTKYTTGSDGTTKVTDESFQTVNGLQFLGIYSFNLGRGSYNNLGFKRLEKYEVAESTSLKQNDSGTWEGTYDASSADNQSHADFVTRYELTDQNPNVFSFECNSNSPAQVVGFAQPNEDALKQLWDIKWTSSNDSENIGYGRLHNIVKQISYINGDTMNYFGTSNVPTYYYTYNNPVIHTADSGVAACPVYRDTDSSYYFVENNGSTPIVESNSDGTYKITDAYRKTLTSDPVTGGVVSDSSYKSLTYSHMTWYEGLKRYEDETAATPDNKRVSEFSKFLINNDKDTAGVYHTVSAVQTPPPDYQISDVDQRNDVATSWMHYPSFSRYFLVALMFGMTDSLGKNLTLRSWDMASSTQGWLYPAFYDMDTGLKLDNGGEENVDPTAHLDYWITNNTGSTGQTVVFTEDSPYPVANANGTTTWYDKNGGNVIGTYTTGDYPQPTAVQYQINNSHLWHMVRFLPSLFDFTRTTENFETVYGYAPLGQYSVLRTKYINTADNWVDTYYKAQNAAVGEMVFNFDYNIKYMKAYINATEGNTTPQYTDLKYCHGRRVDTVRDWLNKRLDFLDSVFNLGHKYLAAASTDSKLGPEAAWNSTTSDNPYYYPWNGTYSEIPSDNDVNRINDFSKIESTANYLSDYDGNKYEAGGNADTVLKHSLISRRTVMMIIQYGSQYITRHFLRAGVSSDATFTRQAGQSITVHVNELNNIYSWDKYRELNLTTINEKLQFESLSLNPQATNSGVQSAVNFTNMPNLKVLDLRNFQTTATTTVKGLNLTSNMKLEELYMNSVTAISGTLSLPQGGNLKTLSIGGSQISGDLTISNAVLLSTLDISDTNITSLTLTGCSSLTSLTFTGNTVLKTITLSDCNNLNSFTYSGTANIDNASTSTSAALTAISITGDCSGLQTITVDNTNATLDFSGATGLSSLSLSSVTSTTPPILPAWILDGKRTDYAIYNGQSFSLSINSVAFRAFAFGNNNYSFAKYVSTTGAYPTVEYVPYEDYATTTGLILNLAPFTSVSLTGVANTQIEYIAMPFRTTPNDLEVRQFTALKRVFGNLALTADAFNLSLQSLCLCDWTGTATELQIKQDFESAVYSYSTTAIDKFMSDMYDWDKSLTDADLVQGIRPATRLTIKGTPENFSNAMRGTAISASDMYYVMLLINKYNHENNGIMKSAASIFNNCANITTSYSEDADLSPSHYLFKDLWSVTTVASIFNGCGSMGGILYSPDHEATDFTTCDYIGTLTPLAHKCTDYANIGWGLNYVDEYTFWTPGSTTSAVSTYYDSTITTDGLLNSSFVHVSDMMSSKTGITSAVYGKINTEAHALDCSVLLTPLAHATMFKNSYNYLLLNLNNRQTVYNNQVYDYSPLLFYMTELVEINNSFNCQIDSVTDPVLVDPFGGSKGVLANYPNNFPQRLTTLKASFTLSGPSQDTQAIIALTDDMFQRVAGTLTYVSPTDSDNPTQVSSSYTSMFGGGSFIHKTYIKYPSDNTATGALFPYGIFKNCSSLTGISGFFGGIDLRYTYDRTGVSDTGSWYSSVIADASRSTAWDSSSISIPDYYSAKPFAPIRNYADGTATHSPVIRMFSDTTAMTNISSAFRGMIAPQMTDSHFMGFELCSEGFSDSSSLVSVGWAFANNHFMKGSVPYRLFYTGQTTETLDASGWNSDVNDGLIGVNTNEITGSVLAGTVTSSSTTGGVVGMLQTAYSQNSKIYVPDNYVPESSAYVIDSSNTSTVVDGSYFATFVKFANGDKTKQKYALVDVSWFQSADATTAALPSAETSATTIGVAKRNITDMNHLFYKNDAVGFLPRRYEADSSIYVQNAYDVVKLYTDNYKLNSFHNDSYLKSGGKYVSAYDFMPNRNYSPYKFVRNAKRDIRKAVPTGEYVDITNEAKIWRYVYGCVITARRSGNSVVKPETSAVETATGVSSSSETNFSTYIDAAYAQAVIDEDDYSANTNPALKGEIVYAVNASYDPRLVLPNTNYNKTTFNKYIADGSTFTDIDTLVNDSSAIILDGVTDTYVTQSDATKIAYVKAQIPQSWLNTHRLVTSPVVAEAEDSGSTNSQSSGIYYPGELMSNSGERSANETIALIDMKNDSHFFVPSDIFSYVNNSANTDITYAFADTNWQQAKISQTTFGTTLQSDASSGDMMAMILNPLYLANKIELYSNGNSYTGIPGCVSPYMFEGLSKLTSIEGIFYMNPQLLPYSYSGYVGDSFINGELFDRDTFGNLTKLTNTYLLWANNIVPRKVRIDPSIFYSNTAIQNMDYTFAGTMWQGYSIDDASYNGNIYGGQIQQGMLDSQSLQHTNAMFASPMNYSYEKHTSSSVSAIRLVSNDPVSYLNGEVGSCGQYGLRHVPEKLFDKSSNTLLESNNMFFYDQQLDTIPNIFFYKNYTYPGTSNTTSWTTWYSRLYHMAFFLNPSNFDETEKNVFYSAVSPFGNFDPSAGVVTGTQTPNYVVYLSNSFDTKQNSNG